MYQKFLHNSWLTRIAYMLCGLVVSVSLIAQPKREFRAAWLTTVWAIDWPTTWGQATASAAAKQQQELYAIVDSLAAANMNAVFFQVRGFSDAMYQSKYEPWSQYLTGTRGQAPSYDPLQTLIEYAHHKGIEVHAWMNPYRYATSDATYGKGENDYANTHPEWLVNCGGITILNPCLPEVRERIAAVVADVVRNYDVDGIIFDDYFYQSGYQNSYDDAYYTNSGTTLSRADWRREQVNTMVAQVRDSIKTLKPYVSFGIGPAGVAGVANTSASVYGVEPCPVGSDWQYNGIYSDPLAWYDRHLIDYMAPQCYWKIGSGNDYARLSEWWSKMACLFGRHLYVSEDLSNLIKDATPVSGSKFHADEIANQMWLNREYDRLDAPGCAWYSLKTGLQTEGYIRHIRNHVNQHPALVPQKLWHHTGESIYVRNIAQSGNLLSWTAPAGNLRYAVYAIPAAEVGQHGAVGSSRNLLGTTYSPSFVLPADADGILAVAVLDRYGNEYPARTIDNTTWGTSVAAGLAYPAEGAQPLLPCYFSWHPAAHADSYFFQLSKSADFSTIDYEYETIDTTFFVGKVYWLQPETTYYWRIRTRSVNCTDTYSAIQSFSGSFFHIVSPAEEDRDCSLTPTIVCDSVATPQAEYTFEVATANSFDKKTIVFTGVSPYPRIIVADSLLQASSYYFVRATVHFNGVSAQSDIIRFRTLALDVPVPVIVSPQDGDTIRATSLTVEWQQQLSSGFRVELSTSENFPSRNTTIAKTDQYTFSHTYTSLTEGLRYIRVKAVADEGYTDPSEVVKVYILTSTAVDNVSVADSKKACKVVENGQIYILRDGVKYSLLGNRVN